MYLLLSALCSSFASQNLIWQRAEFIVISAAARNTPTRLTCSNVHHAYTVIVSERIMFQHVIVSECIMFQPGITEPDGGVDFMNGEAQYEAEEITLERVSVKLSTLCC